MVRGKRAPLVGRVSMDMITIDVTDIADVSMGDMVELWGEHISIHEVAQCAGTIDYELMTRVSQRVPRIVKYL
jgi:alanine racemase